MLQQKLAAVFEISIGDVNERLTEICQRKEELLFDALPIPVRDLINPAFGIEGISEKLAFVTKLFSEERIDKSNVVVDPAHFKDFFTAETQPDIPLALIVVVVALLVV